MQRKYDLNNQITIEYLVNNEDKETRIFGKKFVENNENKCIIICQDDEFDLTEKFELKNYTNNNTLKIKLAGINNITNMSAMFHG